MKKIMFKISDLWFNTPYITNIIYWGYILYVFTSAQKLFIKKPIDIIYFIMSFMFISIIPWILGYSTRNMIWEKGKIKKN